ncbi:MAG: hypothetical protein PHV32_03500 [Eubacteriales bacterium]|nr:hypothetical protein [Eubacteriales bacterium]
MLKIWIAKAIFPLIDKIAELMEQDDRNSENKTAAYRKEAREWCDFKGINWSADYKPPMK